MQPSHLHVRVSRDASQGAIRMVAMTGRSNAPDASDVVHRRTLIAYNMTSTHVQTTHDYLLGLRQHLGGTVEFLHVTHDAHVDLDLSPYDVIFHNYCARLCFAGYVSESYRKALREFRGLKILAVQDEYDHTDVLKAEIRDLGFHLVLTCVPQDSLEYVYPASEFPGVEFMTVFTGYVPDDFADKHRQVLPVAERPILLGYRGRDIGGRYGRLGFEKYEVGRRMREECEARGIACDIAMDEASRIYGDDWFRFVGNCRAMLGSESGSNVFDFDGTIRKQYDAMAAATGRVPSYEEFAPFIAERDAEIDMGQISPRVFECAVMRTPMILIRGRYSGAIEPDDHYIAIERDFSNAGEVLARLEDVEALQAMADRAYDHLVASGQFGYAAFAEQLGEAIQRLAVEHNAKAMPPVPGAGVTNDSWSVSVLREQPTTEPKGMDDYRRKQALLHAPTYADTARHLRGTLVDAARGFEGVFKQYEQTAKVLFANSNGADADDQRIRAQMFDALAAARSAIEPVEQRAARYDDARAELARQRASLPGDADIEAELLDFQIAELDQAWNEGILADYQRLVDAHDNVQRIAGVISQVRAHDLPVAQRAELLIIRAKALAWQPKVEVARKLAQRFPVLRRIARAVITRLRPRSSK